MMSQEDINSHQEASKKVHQVATGQYDNGDRWIFYSDGTHSVIHRRRTSTGRVVSDITITPRKRITIDLLKNK